MNKPIALFAILAGSLHAQVCGVQCQYALSYAGTEIRASRLPDLKGDSNVSTGGGTDDTAVLQSALSTLASNGGGVLILDRACLTTGLTIGSNVTIYAPNSKFGLFLSAGAGWPLVRNANPSTGAVTDKNIALIGGTYNFNVANQTGPAAGNGDYFLQGLGFYGVSGLTIRDIALTSGATGKNLYGYAAMFSNWANVWIENVTVNNNRTGGGGDGLHFVSGSGAVLKNISGFSTSDFIPLNSSDYHDVSLPSPNWVVTDGAIANVLIDGVVLNGSWNGIGLLSGNYNVSNVTVRNVSGTVVNYGISLWNAWSSPYGGGYVDNVSFDNINLACTSGFSGAGNITGMIVVVYALGGAAPNVRNVQFSNVRWVQSTNGPWMYVAANSNVSSLQIRGIQVLEPAVNANNRAILKNNGTVTHVSIYGVDWQRPSGSSATSAIISNSGTMTEDYISGVNAPLVSSITAP
jgi:hypothetical protein